MTTWSEFLQKTAQFLPWLPTLEPDSTILAYIAILNQSVEGYLRDLRTRAGGSPYQRLNARVKLAPLENPIR